MIGRFLTLTGISYSLFLFVHNVLNVGTPRDRDVFGILINIK